MARRFSDTEKWENPKFRILSPELKALYFWMLDTWPHNGFRHLDLGLCSFQVGFRVSLRHVAMTGFRLFTNGERFFFPAFVLTNQSIAMFCELNPSNKAHQGILKAIAEEGLSEFCTAMDNGDLSPFHASYKPLTSPLLEPSNELSPLQAPCKGLASPPSISNSNSISSDSSNSLNQNQKPQEEGISREEAQPHGIEHGKDGHPHAPDRHRDGDGRTGAGSGHAPVATAGDPAAEATAGGAGGGTGGQGRDHSTLQAPAGHPAGARLDADAGLLGADASPRVRMPLGWPQEPPLNNRPGVPGATTSTIAPLDGDAVGQVPPQTRLLGPQAVHPAVSAPQGEIVAQGAESGRRKHKSDLGEPNDPDFHRWWAEYPRKDAKITAFLAWEGNRRHMLTIDDMIDVLRRQIVANEWGVGGKNRKFTPLPASYLNARRWNDEPPPRPMTYEEEMAAEVAKTTEYFKTRVACLQIKTT